MIVFQTDIHGLAQMIKEVSSLFFCFVNIVVTSDMLIYTLCVMGRFNSQILSFTLSAFLHHNIFNSKEVQGKCFVWMSSRYIACHGCAKKVNLFYPFIWIVTKSDMLFTPLIFTLSWCTVHHESTGTCIVEYTIISTYVSIYLKLLVNGVGFVCLLFNLDRSNKVNA